MLARARRRNLVTQEVGDDLVVYDLTSHRAHRLNPTTALIWRHCDGRRTVAELAELVGRGEALVGLALDQLEQAGLLDARLARSAEERALSRRQVLALGLAGVASVLLPGCESMTIPTPDEVGRRESSLLRAALQAPTRCTSSLLVKAPLGKPLQAIGCINGVCPKGQTCEVKPVVFVLKLKGGNSFVAEGLACSCVAPGAAVGSLSGCVPVLVEKVHGGPVPDGTIGHVVCVESTKCDGKATCPETPTGKQTDRVDTFRFECLCK